MTFTRGDIVRLRSDERTAHQCESEVSRQYHLAKRYIVVSQVEPAFAFNTPLGIVSRLGVYTIAPMQVGPYTRRATGNDLIATGERAEEIA